MLYEVITRRKKKHGAKRRLVKGGQYDAGGHRRPVRITSYNVCYTKLLRGARPETDDYKHHQCILLTAYKAGYTTVADPKQAVPSSRIPLYSRPDYIAAAGDNSHLRLRKVESVGEAERISYVANLLNDTCYPPPENINASYNFV